MPNILIADDSVIQRKILRKILETEGYGVLEAQDGNAALKIYRESPTSLVITDLIMPEKEGIETIMELKREFPGSKIIAISGGGRMKPEPSLAVAKKIGAMRTFKKPIKSHEIILAVRELIGP